MALAGFTLFFPFWLACGPVPNAPGLLCRGAMIFDLPYLSQAACEKALPEIQRELRGRVPKGAGFGCAPGDEGLLGEGEGA